MSCLFCSIVEKKIPAEVVYEDEMALAFLDVQPLSPGHTLIIPKQHTETILGLNTENVGPVFMAVQRVTKMLTDTLKPEGFTIGVNHKLHAGVDHLHIHVIPRWKNDGGGSIHTIVKNPPKEPIAEIAKRIRKTN